MTKPPAGLTWRFWQYNGKALLQGYQGGEAYIDLNIFNGTAGEFERYAR